MCKYTINVCVYVCIYVEMTLSHSGRFRSVDTYIELVSMMWYIETHATALNQTVKLLGLGFMVSSTKHKVPCDCQYKI